MAAGDTCTIRAGIYRETVLPRDGQTFQAHPGEQGIISGCDVLTEWELGKDGIARANVPAAVRQVFLADQSLPKARFPDDDGDRYDTSSWVVATASRGASAKTGAATVTFPSGLGAEQ